MGPSRLDSAIKPNGSLILENDRLEGLFVRIIFGFVSSPVLVTKSRVVRHDYGKAPSSYNESTAPETEPYQLVFPLTNYLKKRLQ